MRLPRYICVQLDSSHIRVRFGAAESAVLQIQPAKSEAVQIWLIPTIEAFIRSNPFIDH